MRFEDTEASSGDTLFFSLFGGHKTHDYEWRVCLSYLETLPLQSPNNS